MKDNRRGAEVTHAELEPVGILGAGAIGSALAALLRRAGVPVILVGRSEQVTAIRERGLRVRTQDLASALASHRNGLAGSVLVMCQNGLQADGIAVLVNTLLTQLVHDHPPRHGTR